MTNKRKRSKAVISEGISRMCIDVEENINKIECFLSHKVPVQLTRNQLNFDIYYMCDSGSAKNVFRIYQKGVNIIDLNIPVISNNKDRQSLITDIIVQFSYEKDSTESAVYKGKELLSLDGARLGDLLLFPILYKTNKRSSICEFISNEFSSILFRKLDSDDQILENTLLFAINTYLNERFNEGDIALVKILSEEKYEKNSNFGNLVFVNNENDLKNLVIRFASDGDRISEIDFSKKYIRNIRKLLEVTSEEKNKYVLVVCDKKVVGIGLCANFDKSPIFSFAHGGFEVKLYEPSINAGCVIRFANNKYNLYTSILDDINNNIEKVSSVFGNNYENTNEFINYIYKGVIESKNGAVIIITESAEQEAMRLACCKRGYLFDHKLSLKNSSNYALMSALSNIDGAIILDNDLNCYGMGFILDGFADSNCGDLARGSRFNSSCAYVSYLRNTFPNKKHLGIILSDDGGADYY